MTSGNQGPMEPWAVLTCDLDPIDCHLAGYGVDDAPPCDAIYRRAVPRLLDILDELGLRAVFFVVARDAGQQRTLLRRMRDCGHEIASHSWSHPQPFRGLDDGALTFETSASRAALLEHSDGPVLGFRAPAWDVDARVLSAIAAAGYRYDASVFPSPALSLARLFAEWRGVSGSPLNRMHSHYAWSPRQPHAVLDNGQSLIEFPIAVTPRLRMPAYHTVSHLLGWTAFRYILSGALRSPVPFSYELHAADLLDLYGDGIDARMAVHPGMRTPLGVKLTTLRRVLADVAAARRVVTYEQALPWLQKRSRESLLKPPPAPLLGKQGDEPRHHGLQR